MAQEMDLDDAVANVSGDRARRELEELRQHVEDLGSHMERLIELEETNCALAAQVRRLQSGMETISAAAWVGIGNNHEVADRKLAAIFAATNEAPSQNASDCLERVRQEERERAARICDEEADEWDSDRLVTHKNYAAACADRIRGSDA